MQLTSPITQILNHLGKIQLFNALNPLDETRKYLDTMTFQLSEKKEAVKMIEEFNITHGKHEIPTRMYRPKGKKNPSSSAIIYIHGGWFIAGGFETHDAVVRKLANKTGSVVIFIDYRLAPEHPFPAGLNDCTHVIKWVVDHAVSLGIDRHQIGIIGDSAGGALAAGISTQIGELFKFQILIYPAADNKLNTNSWSIYENGPVLNKKGGIEAWKHYYPTGENQPDPLAVPILIEDFKNTPPTMVILAEHDALRDEGEELAKHMKDSGIPVHISFYKDMVHGFMHMGGTLNEAQQATDEMTAFARQNLEITEKQG